jgi:hypothetical protein
MSPRLDVPVEKPQREVSFSLDGVLFECRPDISMGEMRDYRAKFIPSEEDPEMVIITIDVALDFISSCVVENQRADFLKLVESLDNAAGPAALAKIREFLVSAYSEMEPTTGPRPSVPGPSVSESTLPDDSGSQE